MKDIHTSSVVTGEQLLGKAMKALNFGGRVAAQMAGTNALTDSDRLKMRSSLAGKEIIRAVDAANSLGNKVSKFLPLSKYLKLKK